MTAMRALIALGASIVSSVALAQDNSATNPLATVNPAAMAEAIAKAVAKGELSTAGAAEVTKMVEYFRAESQAAKIGPGLRQIDESDDRSVARRR